MKNDAGSLHSCSRVCQRLPEMMEAVTALHLCTFLQKQFFSLHFLLSLSKPQSLKGILARRMVSEFAQVLIWWFVATCCQPERHFSVSLTQDKTNDCLENPYPPKKMSFSCIFIMKKRLKLITWEEKWWLILIFCLKNEIINQGVSCFEELGVFLCQ